MNKKIKIMIASLLSISCFSVFSPITINAYAEVSTYSLADIGELKSLDVQSTDGQSLQLCNSYGGHKKDLTDDKNYYVVLDGKSDGVKISGKVDGQDYIAKVFESDRKFAAPHDFGEDISLEEGESILYIRTYTSENAFKDAVEDEDVTNCFKTYKIYINKSPDSGAENIGLETLTLDSGKVPINFSRDTLTYNILVDEGQEDIEIKARPEDIKYDVKINGFIADEDNKYKKDLHLQYGFNVIKIVVTDLEYRIKTYTLNITRGKSNVEKDSNVIDTNMVNSTSNDPKVNQWIQVNGKWQYNDSIGNPLKNIWYYDRNYNKYYYLKEDSTMATKWLYFNGQWYYLGQNGAMRTGWENIDNKWYCFDSSGVMKTGWIKDINGKYYYLQSNGIMAENTKINGYKLGDDGAWIK